jgi:hypothetical protein
MTEPTPEIERKASHAAHDNCATATACYEWGFAQGWRSAMEAYRCWCGSPTGVRVPGDRSGVGCLANITHNWAAPVTPCSYTTSTADYCHAHNAPLADTEGRCEAVTGPAGGEG